MRPLALAVVSALAVAAPAPAAMRAFSILPPGQAGVLPPGENSFDQLALFDAMTPLAGNVTEADVPRFYKPADFGTPDMPGVRTEPTPGVTIVRDSFGVPHVFGATRKLVAFGAGWATAEDRSLFIEAIRGPAGSPRSTRRGSTRSRSPPPCAPSPPRRRPRRRSPARRRASRRRPRGGACSTTSRGSSKGSTRSVGRCTARRSPGRSTTSSRRRPARRAIRVVRRQGGRQRVVRRGVARKLGSRRAPSTCSTTSCGETIRRRRPRSPRTSPTWDASVGSSPARSCPTARGRAPCRAAATTTSTPTRCWPTPPCPPAGAPSPSWARRSASTTRSSCRRWTSTAAASTSAASRSGMGMYVVIGRGKDFAWSGTSAVVDSRDVFADEVCDPRHGRATARSTGYLFKAAAGGWAGSTRPARRRRRREGAGDRLPDDGPRPGARRRQGAGALLRDVDRRLDAGQGAARGRHPARPQREPARHAAALRRRDVAAGLRPELVLRRRGAHRDGDLGAPAHPRPAGHRSDLPTLGTGRYEWRGFLAPKAHPQAIDPPAGPC